MGGELKGLHTPLLLLLGTTEEGVQVESAAKLGFLPHGSSQEFTLAPEV